MSATQFKDTKTLSDEPTGRLPDPAKMHIEFRAEVIAMELKREPEREEAAFERMKRLRALGLGRSVTDPKHEDVSPIICPRTRT